MTDAHESFDAEPVVDPDLDEASAAGPDAEQEQPDEAEQEEEVLFEDLPPLEGVAERLEEADLAVAQAEQVLTGDLAVIAAERDELRVTAQRIQADFENYRKRVLRQQTEHLERASEGLVSKLLPVLDACEAAEAHGATDVEPVHAALLDLLEKEGLERLDAQGAPFDPNVHEAVMHEEGDGEPTVSEVLRTGYLFKGRVLRPAMVKVAG